VGVNLVGLLRNSPRARSLSSLGFEAPHPIRVEGHHVSSLALIHSITLYGAAVVKDYFSRVRSFLPCGRPEGSSQRHADRAIARRPYIRSIQLDRYHDAAMRIGAKLLGGGPILVVGTKPLVIHGVTTTSDRSRKPATHIHIHFRVVGLRILKTLPYRFMPLAA
jgi:hypothetical protein